MRKDYRDISDRTITDANTVNRSLIEKALAMRCSTYLSQIKASLLTDTIYEIDNTKKILSSINVNLKKEVNERKEAEAKLRDALIEVERTTKLKDRFVVLVSHDLKNPLHIMQGNLDLLRLSGDLSDGERELVENGLAACRNMAKLISDILDLSRIQAGRIKPRCSFVEVEGLVAEVFEDLQSIAGRKDVNLVNEVPAGITLYADERFLAQALTNLVDNAIKFCEAEDRVRVFVPEGEESSLAVADTGRGIDADRVAQLLGQESETTTLGTDGEKGSGVGLSLVNDIVMAHGGEIEVDSTPGEGSTFTIKLPKVGV